MLVRVNQRCRFGWRGWRARLFRHIIVYRSILVSLVGLVGLVGLAGHLGCSVCTGSENFAEEALLTYTAETRTGMFIPYSTMINGSIAGPYDTIHSSECIATSCNTLLYSNATPHFPFVCLVHHPSAMPPFHSLFHQPPHFLT